MEKVTHTTWKWSCSITYEQAVEMYGAERVRRGPPAKCGLPAVEVFFVVDGPSGLASERWKNRN